MPRSARVRSSVALSALCAVGVIAPGCPGRMDGDAGLDVVDVPWTHPDVAPDIADDPRLFVFVTDAATGLGLPCKLTVTNLDDPRWAPWGRGDQVGEWLDRENHALGTGRWVLMARGRAAFVLPPGRYRLQVTRGMEYALLDLGMVEIRPGRGAVVRGELRRVVDTAGEVAGEFHVHSDPSGDSDVPLDQRVVSLAVEGVEVFASTDHNAVGDFGPVIARLGLERHVHWIRGNEITPRDDVALTSVLGHFNVYPLPGDLDDMGEFAPDVHPSVSALVQRARAVAPGAVIQLNHPMWRQHSIGYWNLAGFDPTTGRARTELFSMFHTVEVWNSHTLDQDPAFYDPPDRVIDAWMTTLQLGRGATAVGNTDTHRLSQSPPGWPRTYVRVADDDPARVTDAMVQAALRDGDASLTSGPFLRATVNGVRPGAVVQRAGRDVTVRVELQAPAWTPVSEVEVWANRQRVAVRPVTAAPVEGYVRQSWDVPVTLTRDAWVVVRTDSRGIVRDLAGSHAQPLPSLALVNPVYVDVDGDGAWAAPGVGNGP